MAVYWQQVCIHEADVHFGPYHTTYGDTAWMVVPGLCCSTGIMRDRNISVSWARIASVGQNGQRELSIWAPSSALPSISAPEGSALLLSNIQPPLHTPSLDVPSFAIFVSSAVSTHPGTSCCYAVEAMSWRWLAEMIYMLPLWQVLFSDVFGRA
ncbi:hypothetical protein CCMA1212_007766 [Trichoderma ghanense]|uniref:Uncharacterized protein n=1 Tax=Trichoderma ghanense TaxID=65468 RepID=A0ABY2GY84_9HYPO